ncbi:expressed protein, partial [Phakopsora pachyrhizi]
MKANEIKWRLKFTLVLIVISSQFISRVQGDSPAQSCQFYSKIDGTAFVCDEYPDQVCKSGCTGSVTVTGCSKEGDAKKSQQMCTKGCKKSGDVLTCINEEATFSCVGSVQGSMSCSGCIKNTGGGIEVSGSFSAFSSESSYSYSSSWEESSSQDDGKNYPKDDAKNYPKDDGKNYPKDDAKNYPKDNGKNYPEDDKNKGYPPPQVDGKNYPSDGKIQPPNGYDKNYPGDQNNKTYSPIDKQPNKDKPNPPGKDDKNYPKNGTTTNPPREGGDKDHKEEHPSSAH